MPNPSATIQCSNIHCQASNPLSNNFCQKCSTPILKRYLRVSGQENPPLSKGELIGDRYLVEHTRLVLDTKPTAMPEIPEEIPTSILHYLKLFPFRLNLPQIHGKLPQNNPKQPSWLLNYNSTLTQPYNLSQGQLFPNLIENWPQQSGLRQLNWLWQIAGLWKPMQTKGVVSTLLTPELLGINGPLLQIIELQKDFKQNHTLRDLGKFWLQLVPQADDKIKDFLQELCQKLQQGNIEYADTLTSILDQALQQAGKCCSRSYQIFTATDSGRAREHNEDSCYPSPNELIKFTSEQKPLAIVCDGIGGHEGGEIASQLAIDSLTENLESLNLNTTEFDPNQLLESLETFACNANDLISQRNDQEKRQERQRMGTTLVMTLAHDHEMYLTHVGDSRIYWITKEGCHSVTVDDDLASREVRLGYALYSDAVKYPSAGALVQALGMGASSMLHPTVQRLIIDETSVFLLCSDGLSDFDRVDQHWQTEILPLLDQPQQLVSIGQKLIQIANEKNGHDNVTIALLLCQVNPEKLSDKITIAWEEVAQLSPSTDLIVSGVQEPFEEEQEEEEKQEVSQAPELVVTQSQPQKSWLLFAILNVVFGLGLGLIIFAVFGKEIQNFLYPPEVTNPNPTPVTVKPSIKLGDVIKLDQELDLKSTINPDTNNQDGVYQAPEGTIIKIISQTENSEQYNIKVCLTSDATLEQETGELILEIKELNQFSVVTETTDLEKLEKCPK
jgi:protein phosphatase